MTLKTSDFDYDLPPELIAQQPLAERDASRMMVVHRQTGAIDHRRFSDLPDLLTAGDLLVLNDTRVIPARLFGTRKGTGGKVELLLVERVGGEQRPTSNEEEWTALCRAGWKPKEGIRLSLADGQIDGVITAVGEEGKVTIVLSSDEPLTEVIEKHGVTPLPPYIRRQGSGSRGQGAEDCVRYQTIYAAEPGAVAAPTAGLHFTDDMFEKLAALEVRKTTITLHVGPGTFRPVKTETVTEHKMEEERYWVDERAADAINAARSKGNRIVAVGSTSVRTLETVVSEKGMILPGCGRSSLFIHPPFSFRAVDVMLTNFHLPKSTLVMMVSAFAGTDLVRHAYNEAAREKYRFYSYGDCMLIL
ncbi:tRNA preQ1(34) S-adenosylmethionine ribosyltransferase-isomerase QueA [Verrucomicrobiota bacterium]